MKILTTQQKNSLYHILSTVDSINLIIKYSNNNEHKIQGNIPLYSSSIHCIYIYVQYEKQYYVH